MTITENPRKIYVHPPPPYEVAVNLDLWATNSQYHTKNTLFKVGDRVKININWLTGGQFPSEIYHDRIPTEQLEKYYKRTKLVGQEFIISLITDRGNYDVIDLFSSPTDLVYAIAFCPSHLDKVY
jgi:hypothetical protein